MGDLVSGVLGVDSPDYGDAIEAARFKPWTISSGLGSTTYDPTTQTASYKLSKPLRRMREQFLGAAQEFLPTTQQAQFAQGVSDYGMGLFNRAAGMDTSAYAKDYYDKIIGLQQEARAAEQAQLADTLFKTGRTGAGVGMEGGYVNPEQFAYLKALQQANNETAIASYDRARQQQQQDMALGTGYYGSGQQMRMSPYQMANEALGYGTSLDALGLGLLDKGMTYGSMVSSAQAPMVQGMMQQQNADYQNSLFGAGLLGNLASGAFTGLGGWGAVKGLFGGAGGGAANTAFSGGIRL